MDINCLQLKANHIAHTEKRWCGEFRSEMQQPLSLLNIPSNFSEDVGNALSQVITECLLIESLQALVMDDFRVVNLYFNLSSTFCSV
jgi:hypothetical protein